MSPRLRSRTTPIGDDDQIELIMPMDTSNPSPREKQILIRIAHGYTIGEIAESLGLRQGNVRNRLNMMRNKYAATNAALAAIAVTLRWIPFRLDVGRTHFRIHHPLSPPKQCPKT